MYILLLGEYSGLHHTLAEGLRQLGHQVTVASDGDGWKNYPRDIDLNRPTDSLWDAIKLLWKLLRVLPRLKGYDVVQIISPHFLRLKPHRCLPIYHYLRKRNGGVFMGAFGTDYYYTHACMYGNIYRYSDYKIGDHFKETPTNRSQLKDELEGSMARATKVIAKDCDGIIACLWEYYAAYQKPYPQKIHFIPLPIDLRKIKPCVRKVPQQVNFFIGIQTRRSDVKGTDIMLPILRKVAEKYPERCRITEVSNVPYAEYCRLLDAADVQLDQLYSYTPSMNSLLAMAKGIVVVGGGEPENYEILREEELRPIVNVLPDEDDIFRKLEELVLHPERIPTLSEQSIAYVKKHHDAVEVARQYLLCWKKADEQLPPNTSQP
ncbi:MAG: glycosyltransferase family 4 protein [Bacteroides sp.]|nr:glycosyltransferase family 4 protein [Bacteroides sp.]